MLYVIRVVAKTNQVCTLVLRHIIAMNAFMYLES